MKTFEIKISGVRQDRYNCAQIGKLLAFAKKGQHAQDFVWLFDSLVHQPEAGIWNNSNDPVSFSFVDSLGRRVCIEVWTMATMAKIAKHASKYLYEREIKNLCEFAKNEIAAKGYVVCRIGNGGIEVKCRTVNAVTVLLRNGWVTKRNQEAYE